MDLNPYAKFLDGRDPIPVITSTADHLRDLTGPLSPAQADVPTAPGKWSVREIIAHLADCELVFSFRLRQTLAEDAPHHPAVRPGELGRALRRLDLASAPAHSSPLRATGISYSSTT